MKPLAERLGRDPNTQEHYEDLQGQIDALTKRLAALEAMAEDKPKGKKGAS